jgi:hypothetical protein
MTPFENLLAKLPEAKRVGKGRWVQCPAHDDWRASLSVSEGQWRRRAALPRRLRAGDRRLGFGVVPGRSYASDGRAFRPGDQRRRIRRKIRRSGLTPRKTGSRTSLNNPLRLKALRDFLRHPADFCTSVQLALQDPNIPAISREIRGFQNQAAQNQAHLAHKSPRLPPNWERSWTRGRPCPTRSRPASWQWSVLLAVRTEPPKRSHNSQMVLRERDPLAKG